MRRLSLARSVQLALLGLTLILTLVAGVGVAALYSSRQDYEDRFEEALELQASAARLFAAGVVEEATLRTADNDASRLRAQRAFAAALAASRAAATGDEPSTLLVEQIARAQDELRTARASRAAALAARRPVAELSDRQEQRIKAAKRDATDESRSALVAIALGGGMAVLVALGLIAALLAAVRRPLDDLVNASGRLAGGDLAARVEEDGPDELRELGRSFNAMATDLERARERIEAERRRLDITVRSLGDGLVIVGEDGRIAAVNPRATQIAPGAQPGVALVAAGLPLPPLEDALAGEVQVSWEAATLAVTAARLAEAEGEGGVVWTLRDVSERARLERLKSEFVATASHELRSPLTSIKGFIELLAAGEGLTARQREFVEIVNVSTNRLVELVNDLLDVARIEAGRVEIHRRPTDVSELAQDVATLLRPRIEGRQQTLAVDAPAGLPAAFADPGRIRQILTNLLTNAHLYTQDGGSLALRVDHVTAGIRIAVSDTGRGMSPTEIEHAFERFYRGGDGASAPGTGLGLAIVKSLVELHRGAIDVTSAAGEGATFTVTLPLAPVAGDASAPRHALRGKRVLVLDDERDVARLIAERLAPYGVETTIALDGEQALARLRSERFDAITVDILMPGMTGFEVLRALREDPSFDGLPVVVVSVFSGREALSGEWVVSKPIDPDELADALGAAVLAGRVRVVVAGREEVRDRLSAVLDQLSINHTWAIDAQEIARLCDERRFEVALIDVGLVDAQAAIAALDLRGRRLHRSVVVFSDSDDAAPGWARLDAEPVALADAGTTVLGLLEAQPPN